MKAFQSLILLLLGVTTMTFTACDGIFEDIYDEPRPDGLYGFTHLSTPDSAGTIYVNASEYTRWIYINFRTASIDSLTIVEGGEEYHGDWDIAVHRYDAKTNHGAVLETDYTDLQRFIDDRPSTEGAFVGDVDTDSTIIVDMSHMMEGEIGYVSGKVNLKLSEWLHRDMSSMPPVYTLSGKVYVVRLRDGSKAAVRLSDFMNETYNKGYLTIQYNYPLQK